ncbi:hypothetical protein C5C45_13020 [Rathayibacter rathayi]|nr:hypothetical protein C5C08_12420 [Rathayibacter rathayi]PPH64221.1 hypothetical protein C5C45_13020 [Rathayibacter rathayi]
MSLLMPQVYHPASCDRAALPSMGGAGQCGAAARREQPQRPRGTPRSRMAGMTIGRRLFLSGTVTGVGLLALVGCTPSRPRPTRSVTKAPVPTTSTTAVPAPAAFVRSAWGSDPYALGSVSYLPVSARPQDRSDLAGSVLDRLFLAGEATDTQTPGTLQGAWNSGVRAAAEISTVAEEGERIAIVGAGLAGAVATRRLVDSGFDVTVVEARDRTGGRIATSTPDGWPIAVEAGAWALTGAGAALRESVADAGIATTAVDLTGIRSTGIDGSPLDTGTTGADALSRALEWGAEQPEDLSLAESFASSGAADPAEAEPGSGDGDPARVAARLAGTTALRTGAAPEELSSWYGLGDASAAPVRATRGRRRPRLGNRRDALAALRDRVLGRGRGGALVARRLRGGDHRMAEPSAFDWRGGTRRPGRSGSGSVAPGAQRRRAGYPRADGARAVRRRSRLRYSRSACSLPAWSRSACPRSLANAPHHTDPGAAPSGRTRLRARTTPAMPEIRPSTTTS